MNSKKLFAGVIALAMAAAIVPSAGQAATAEELAAQIAQLQAQLASLMGQLGGTTGTTGTTSSTAPAACAGISFTRNLTLGSQGTDVQCLQALLNQDPATQVAASGVGSAGNESQYFGGLTKAAVVAFQNKYAAEILAPVGLTAGTGFVGASTRAKLNAMLVGGTTGTTGGTTGTTGTTLPEGCTSTAGYSSVTGEPCSSTSTSTGTGLTMTGQEGSITVSINPSPASGTKTYEGDEKVAVMGLKVKATGSDVDVQRVTLQFGVQPYSYFTNVYLYDGDTQVASSALNSTTVSKVTSTNYQITLAGFTSKVIVPVNTDKVLTVKLDVLPGISSGLLVAGTKDMNIGMPSETAIRAVDQAGLNQYGGVAYGTTNRKFSVNASQAANATLALSLNANSPKKRNIVADSNQEISGAVLMTFDLKASKDDLIIDEILDVDFGASQIPATAYVVDDGGTVIGTISPSATAGNNDFTELDYTISKDTTKTLSIKVDDTLAAPDTTTRVSADDGNTYTVAIGTGKVGFTKSNGTTGTSTGTATSNVAYVYAEGPEFTLTNITTTNTQAPFDGASSTMSATFNIQVKAVNGDVYISATTTDAFLIDSVVGGASTRLGDVTYVQPTNTVLVGGTYKVSEGNTATFAVTATATNGGTAGTYDIRVNSIKWGHLSTDPIGVTSDYMNGEAAWISPAIYLR